MAVVMVEPNQVCNLMNQVAANVIAGLNKVPILKNRVRYSVPDISDNSHDFVFNPASSVEDQFHMNDAGSELVIDFLVVQSGCLGEFPGQGLGFKTG